MIEGATPAPGRGEDPVPAPKSIRRTAQLGAVPSTPIETAMVESCI